MEKKIPQQLRLELKPYQSKVWSVTTSHPCCPKAHLVGVVYLGERQPVEAHQLVPQHPFVPQFHNETRVQTHGLTA